MNCSTVDSGFREYDFPLTARGLLAIGMDWIVGLPRITRDGRVYDSVLTVTDRATKMTHFIPTWKEATAVDTADQFIRYIVKYHGLPRSII